MPVSWVVSKWKVPSFVLFLPRWLPLSPFRHHQKAEQDAENLKNGPLWAARGSADTIKEWYQLQIMHVSRLILVLSERNRTAQRYTDAPQRKTHMLSQTKDISPEKWRRQELAVYNPTLMPFNNYMNHWNKPKVLRFKAHHICVLCLPRHAVNIFIVLLWEYGDVWNEPNVTAHKGDW